MGWEGSTQTALGESESFLGGGGGGIISSASSLRMTVHALVLFPGGDNEQRFPGGEGSHSGTWASLGSQLDGHGPQ